MSDEVKIPLPRSLQEIVGSLLFASETPLTALELRTAVRSVAAEDGENREIMDVYGSCTSKEIDEALRGLGKALDVDLRLAIRAQHAVDLLHDVGQAVAHAVRILRDQQATGGGLKAM